MLSLGLELSERIHYCSGKGREGVGKGGACEK